MYPDKLKISRDHPLTPPLKPSIVRQMPNQSLALDTVFQALASQTRRDVVVRLSRGPASVKELAAPFNMALPSFLQHLEVLEKSGIVSSRKVGRVRTYQIQTPVIAEAETWLGANRKIWETRLDQLDEFLLSQKDKP